MLKENTSRNFSEHIIPILKDYLCVDYFLYQKDPIPNEKDLLKYICTGSNSWAFTDYLIQNIHRLIYVDSFSDELKTVLTLHIQNMKERKISFNY